PILARHAGRVGRADRSRHRARGRGRLSAPHARQAHELRAGRQGPRPEGDHRGSRRCRAPAGHARVGDARAGHRRAGAAEDPRGPRLAAVDRADARGDPRGDRVDQRREERRAPGSADPRRVGRAGRRPPRGLCAGPLRAGRGEERAIEGIAVVTLAAERMAAPRGPVINQTPLRTPDTANPGMMTRRGWWLVVLNFLIPGSAQSLAGNRRLGKFGLGATLLMWTVLVILLLGVLLWREVVTQVLLTPIAFIVLGVLIAAYAVLWVVLSINTLRLVRLVKTKSP